MISSNFDRNASNQDSRNAKLPFYCVILTLLVAIGGFENGLNTGITNIPEQTIRNCSNGYKSVQGVGVPYCLPMGNLLWGFATGGHPLGAIIGGLSAGSLQTILGRKKALIYNSIFWIIGGVLLGASVNPGMFICGRILTGIGTGVGSVVIPTYLGEISTIRSRGLVGSVYQDSVVIGIVVSQLISLPLTYIPGWRILLTLTSAIAILQLILIPIIGVETPRYLISQNQISKAKETLQKLRKGYNIDLEFDEILQGQSEKQINEINENTIEKDEKYIQNSLVETNNQFEIKKSSSFKDILQDSYCRKALFICIGTHIAQQLNGIQAIVYYSTGIFLTVMGDSAKYVTLIIGSALLLVTLTSTFLIDRMGRRPLLLLSEIGVTFACFLIVIGSIYENNILLIIALSLLELCRSLSSQMEEALQDYTFLIFGVIGVFCIIFIWIFVPETKGKSIEEITSKK
ncbi:1256_t:CDS:2 [Dentiscutata erythropus]|uniref:1256_t:CDS:1 n=1 Tax=Dentiscutata erythropus TaxID=1348616 RepID=A0A9N9GKE6_9GLOM|nr:1256_t:CDS:2 [Dentiscutata erythropus]